MFILKYNRRSGISGIRTCSNRTSGNRLHDYPIVFQAGKYQIESIGRGVREDTKLGTAIDQSMMGDVMMKAP